MTYCVAITVNTGIVLASDSRTSAGVDQISTYGKMHQLLADGERMVTLLSAGNLATSQAVVRQLNQDLKKGELRTLKTLGTLAEIAEYVGAISVAEQSKHSSSSEENFKPEASFILAGQIKGPAASDLPGLFRRQLHTRRQSCPIPADRRTEVRQADSRSHR